MSFNKFKSSDSDNSAPGGMLTIIIVVVFLMLAFAYWVWTESPVWSWKFIKARTEKSLTTSSIVETEQSQIMDVFDQLSDKIEDHSIGWLEIPKLVKSISESEFAPIALSIYLQASAVQPLGLEDAEAKRAHKAILRLNWAVMNDAIPSEELDPLWDKLGKPKTDEVTVTLGKDIFLSKEELKTFISEAEQLLNKHEVPEQPFTFDPSEALQEALNQYLDLDTKKEEPAAL